MAELLKNLYNETYIDLLASKIKYSYKDFNMKGFKVAIFSKGWSTLELKERMRHIASILGIFLPGEYKNDIEILQDTFVTIDSKYALENMVFQDFVEVYGMDEFEVSMKALAVFTVGSSSEFAIRRFILKYPTKAMVQMREWAISKDKHIRRLSSEGCRPRLPWAISLPIFKQNPKEIIKILNLLKNDESEYVRKSVANNINDISKDNPQIIIELTKEWIGYSKNRDKLLKHGCRTMLKASNVEVLELFGIKKAKHVKLVDATIQHNVKMGDALEFSFTLQSFKELGFLRIEYQMEFLRQNKSYSKKMFKICEGEFKQNIKEVVKKHSFKLISTRRYYNGIQRIHIYVNGEKYESFIFNLSE